MNHQAITPTMTIPQNPKIISRLSLMCPSLRKRVYNNIATRSCRRGDRIDRNVRFWHKADIAQLSSDVRFWGVNRTSEECAAMSAFDPKRTCVRCPGSVPCVQITTHLEIHRNSATGPMCPDYGRRYFILRFWSREGNPRCVVRRRFPTDGAFFACFPPTLRHSVLFLMLIAYCRVFVHSCRRRGSSSLLRTCPHHG